MSPTTPHRRHLLIALLLITLTAAALILPPLINVNRYQRQIAASLAAGLGHTVQISGVHLELLPRPGVQIENFVVDSSNGFSAEPILQCSSVTAAFRLTSLWRGRLEISRISLDEPSLNLERAGSGQWNFASVLLQASRTPQAPTGRQIPHAQNRFPYIEANNARVNFKNGAEKLPFSFLNADASIWLENPNEWQLRFQAQPFRTDLYQSPSDTGVVQISGSVLRASTTQQLPMDLQLEWRKAPLGQVTRILWAEDMGWRGDTELSVRLTGVPDALAIHLTAGAADFHRESFVPTSPLNVQVSCTATYRHAVGSLDAIHCLSPVGDGRLLLAGSVSQLHVRPTPDLTLTAVKVPAGAALDVLRHTRNSLPESVRLAGHIDGQADWTQRPTSQGMRSSAQGSFTAAQLLLTANDVQQSLPDLHMALSTTEPLRMVLQPASLNLGGTRPVLGEAQLNRQGFTLRYTGSAEMSRLLPLAQAFHVAQSALQGVQGGGGADLNLTVHGDWIAPMNDSTQPTPLTQTSGTLTLHNTVFQPSYLAEPIRIASATATFSPAELRWSGIAAVMGPTRFGGNFTIPFDCYGACARRFDLTASSANIGDVMASLHGDDEGVVAELIHRVRMQSQRWPEMQGSLHIARLTGGRVDVNSAAITLAIVNNRIHIQSLDGRVLGGTVHATGMIAPDVSPTYDMDWELSHINALELSQLLGERWGPGSLDISASLILSGRTSEDLSRSAKGNLHWEWTDGALLQAGASPMRHFDRWSGEGAVTQGTLTITHSDVASGGAVSPVTGSIDSDRTLHLKIGSASSDTAQALGGTLAAPMIETQ